MPTAVPMPFAPIIFTAILSYFMAGLFMDIFELAVLAFIFAKQKNENEFGDRFGPDHEMIDEIQKEIDSQDLSKYHGNKRE